MNISEYGTWQSPITPDLTARGEKSARSTYIVVDGQEIYWTESRPLEKGRTVVMHCTPDGKLEEMTPAGFDVRTKVHEYGGLSFTAHRGTLYFINSKDQCLYTQGKALTQEGIRFAEPLATPFGLVCIAEENKNNYLALVDPETGKSTPLDRGHDFYASPTLSPDGKKLAWLTWDHPNMPWDGTKLWVAEFEAGKLLHKTLQAGSSHESIFQPQWSPKSNLYYISDRSGWWNIYAMENENICPKNAEFGLPQWGLGISTWRFTGEGEQIICSFQENGVGKLGLLDPAKKQLEVLDLGGTDFAQIAAGKGFAVFLMGSKDAARRVMKLDLKTKRLTAIDKPTENLIGKEYFSIPQSISFPSANQRKSYGYFYPPRNPNYQAPKGSLPPLIVMSHGGPTAAADPVLNLRMQYWTSRGFAVLDVNYGGSTGFGRAYRESLRGRWGQVDVEDCSYGALYLAREGKVDPKKILIRGASAGGYTTLAALAFTDTFAAGASYYGVADLELLAKDTHKFEAYYLESLVGPYPQEKQEYYRRSPLHHAAKITCPVIFFQGGKDKVVPQNQAEKMFQALKDKGLKTELILYPDEEHGFRQAENVQDSLEKELNFYLDVLK